MKSLYCYDDPTNTHVLPLTYALLFTAVALHTNRLVH
jgi:hypothetical protein